MKKLFYIPGIILLLIFTIFFIRFFSETQIDDITPGISCEIGLLEKSDIFFVIPKFENKSITDNSTWCENILNLNKKLALHGVYHVYEEFSTDRNENYLNEGIKIFEECFGYSPKRFKPGQLAISENNKIMIKSKMKLEGFWNQFFHKVYHCEDTGIFPNWIVDLF